MLREHESADAARIRLRASAAVLEDGRHPSAAGSATARLDGNYSGKRANWRKIAHSVA
jgi:hypothetical protein